MTTLEPQVPRGNALVPFRWDLLGFGLCRAWVTSLLAFSGNEIWGGGLSLSLQIVLYFAAALVAGALALASKPAALARMARREKPFALVSAGIGLLGMVCIILGKLDHVDALFLAGLVLAGSCGGYFETVWGSKFVNLSSDGIQVYTFFAMAVSSLFGIAAGFLPSTAFYLASTIMLGAMTALFLAQPFRTADKDAPLPENAAPMPDRPRPEAEASPRLPEPSVGQPAERQGRRALANLLLSCLLFSLIYNLIVTVAYDSLPSETASQIRFWANLLAALILLCTFLLVKPLSATTLFRLVLPITAVGFVLYLVSPSVLSEPALALSSMGRKFFDILTWILVAKAVQEFSLPPTRYFGLLVAGKNLGYAGGSLLATMALDALDAAVIQLATLVPILMLALIVCFFWLLPERTIDHLFNAAPSLVRQRARERTTAEAAEALASRFGLTPRETEVLVYMAKGRNLSVIAAKLTISKGTAHTHMIHIYQKLGVHQQQELIEMVERLRLQEDDPR